MLDNVFKICFQIILESEDFWLRQEIFIMNLWFKLWDLFSPVLWLCGEAAEAYGVKLSSRNEKKITKLPTQKYYLIKIKIKLRTFPNPIWKYTSKV